MCPDRSTMATLYLGRVGPFWRVADALEELQPIFAGLIICFQISP